MPKTVVFKRVIQGALFGVALSFLLVLLLSLCLYKEWLGLESIAACNTGIKVIAACGASLLSIRRPMRRQWITGALAGFLYAFLAYMLFALLSGAFSVSAGLLSDLGMGLLSGMFSAMLRQMLK